MSTPPIAPQRSLNHRGIHSATPTPRPQSPIVPVRTPAFTLPATLFHLIHNSLNPPPDFRLCTTLVQRPIASNPIRTVVFQFSSALPYSQSPGPHPTTRCNFDPLCPIAPAGLPVRASPSRRPINNCLLANPRAHLSSTRSSSHISCSLIATARYRPPITPERIVSSRPLCSTLDPTRPIVAQPIVSEPPRDSTVFAPARTSPPPPRSWESL